MSNAPTPNHPVDGISVVIVNWYSEDHLATTLAALDRQTRAPARVVIIDNGSRAPIPVERYGLGPIVARSMPGNLGFAAGNNRALFDEVDTEWVALLNPDAIPEPDWLECLARAVERHPEVAAFGSLQLCADDPGRLDGLGDVYHVSGAAWRAGYRAPAVNVPTTPVSIFAPCAAAALYRRAALVELGGFDEDYFCYFEDVDLGFRLRRQGYQCLLVPDAVVRHVGSLTSGGQQSDFAVYHGHRNLVWTFFKNMPTGLLWRYLPQHLLFNLVSVLFFSLRGQARVILRAKRDALLGLPRVWRKRAPARVASDALRVAMMSGWLAPYRRKLGVLSDTADPN